MIGTNKTISIAAWIYLVLNVILSSAQYFFRVFPDGWIDTIFAADLIIPATVIIVYLLFFSKRT